MANFTFADFREDEEFKDWNNGGPLATVTDQNGDTVFDQNGIAVTSGGYGTTYVSFLETAWAIAENDYGSWVGSPYIYTWMNNKANVQVTDQDGDDVTTLTDQLVTAGVNYGLTMKGKWDWVEKG